MMQAIETLDRSRIESYMLRIARQRSETSFYHIVCRGASKQIIFEDDDDKAFFME